MGSQSDDVTEYWKKEIRTIEAEIETLENSDK